MTNDQWRGIVAGFHGVGFALSEINAAWQRARATGTSRDDPAKVVEAAVRRELEGETRI